MAKQTLIDRLKAAEEALAWCCPSSARWDAYRAALSDLRELIKEAEGQEYQAVVIFTESYELPRLQWRSADHSFRHPAGTRLYTALGEKP